MLLLLLLWVIIVECVCVCVCVCHRHPQWPGVELRLHRFRPGGDDSASRAQLPRRQSAAFRQALRPQQRRKAVRRRVQTVQGKNRGNVCDMPVLTSARESFSNGGGGSTSKIEFYHVTRHADFHPTPRISEWVEINATTDTILVVSEEESHSLKTCWFLMQYQGEGIYMQINKCTCY